MSIFLGIEKGTLVLTLWHKTLPWEDVLVLDEVPADISMYLGADLVNYAWKLPNQLKKGSWLEVEAWTWGF